MPTTTTTQIPIHILVVDDEPAILDAYRDIFSNTTSESSTHVLGSLKSKLFGARAQANIPPPLFDLACYNNAESAVNAVQAGLKDGQPFSVIFLDVRMPPGPDGVWAASRIRNLQPDVDIVMVTAYSDVDLRQISTQVPPEDKLFYVQKPFHPHEIRQLALALGRKAVVERKVRQLAYFDNLTSLPNRVLFLDRLEQAVQRAQRYHRQAGVLFLDLDNFKRINDTLGHRFGDEILRVTAQRLQQCVRLSDAVTHTNTEGTAARLGGDEFTVVLSEIDSPEAAALVARRILQRIAEPIHLDQHEMTVTPSIGIAVFPDDGQDGETLLKNADLAMFFAKRTGPNTFQYYRETMNAAATRRLLLENHLRRAVARQEFTLHYQPQIDLTTGTPCGVEALLRWHDTELGDIQPVEFIAVAEDSGLIVTIGEWVLRTACRQAQRWRELGIPVPRVAVNVSPKQFSQRNFHDLIAQVLAETGLAPEVLEIEVTESLLMHDTESALATLTKIKALGVQLAIDDFGTGYSSLSRLKQFPIDRLKIDRSFVSMVDTNPSDQAITSAVIAMASSLNMRVVAEGVETANQLDFLRSKSCNEIQGYLMSYPLPVEEAERFLRQLKP